MMPSLEKNNWACSKIR